MPSNVPAHRTPRISASRPLAFVAPEDSQSKTYSSTGLWGKRKMTYAELQTVWSEYNENEERCAIGYATSEYVDRILSERLKSSDLTSLEFDEAHGLVKDATISHSRSSRSSMEDSYLMFNDASSISPESCASEETIRPRRRHRRRRSPSIIRDQLRDGRNPTRKDACLHFDDASQDETDGHSSSSNDSEDKDSTIRPYRHGSRRRRRPSLHLESISFTATRSRRANEGFVEHEVDNDDYYADKSTHHVEEVIEDEEEEEEDREHEAPERPPSRLDFFVDTDE